KSQVRHLLGSKVYIEYDEEKYHADFIPFKEVKIKGRLVPFGPGSELDKVRKFFADYYGRPIDEKAWLVVVDEQPKTEARYFLVFLLSLALIVISLYYSINSILKKDED